MQLPSVSALWLRLWAARAPIQTLRYSPSSPRLHSANQSSLSQPLKPSPYVLWVRRVFLLPFWGSRRPAAPNSFCAPLPGSRGSWPAPCTSALASPASQACQLAGLRSSDRTGAKKQLAWPRETQESGLCVAFWHFEWRTPRDCSCTASILLPRQSLAATTSKSCRLYFWSASLAPSTPAKETGLLSTNWCFPVTTSPPPSSSDLLPASSSLQCSPVWFANLHTPGTSSTSFPPGCLSPAARLCTFKATGLAQLTRIRNHSLL